MYKIVGADSREYGPATAELIREWIALGRANGETMIQSEGAAEWKPLSSFPEFAEALAAKAGAPAPLAALVAAEPSSPLDAETLANEILTRDYELDIFSCLNRGWEKLQSNFWPIVGVSAVMLLLLMIAGATSVGIVLSGPLLGGLYWYYLKLIRGENAEMSDAFAGFTIAFLQLLLGSLVSTLLVSLGIILCLVPGIYLGVAWSFALPLIIDKRLDFWPAMELSRKVIGKHWWSLFGLLLLSGLINMVGVLLCCVGTFVTTPVTLLAMMYAYEDIFLSVLPAQSLKPV